jgi:anthranilate phosphoribosyltransferase
LQERISLEGKSSRKRPDYPGDSLRQSRVPKRDAVLLNAAAALYVARPELSIQEGIAIATELIDSGKALAQLESFITRSSGKLPKAAV